MLFFFLLSLSFPPRLPGAPNNQPTRPKKAPLVSPLFPGGRASFTVTTRAGTRTNTFTCAAGYLSTESNRIHVVALTFDEKANLDECRSLRHRHQVTSWKWTQNYLKLFPNPVPEGRSELLAKLLGTQLSEAVYIINYLHRSLKLPGDVCEFGVAQGATSALLANEIRDTDKLLWLFDSFAGLPKPTEKDTLIHDIFGLGTIESTQGTMAYELRGCKKSPPFFILFPG